MQNHQQIILNGTWDLRDEILGFPIQNAFRLINLHEGWIKTPVPGDIHQGLITAGRIQEPLVGLNSFDSQWTENRSWWFRKKFVINEESLSAEVIELEMNGLDANAEIFLNIHHPGSHRNAFRPFLCNIKPFLEAGENTLLVRLTTGVETVSEIDTDTPDGVRTNTEAQNGRPDRGDARRSFVRKPQYSFGWDWSPRIATTAIAGDVKIRFMNQACIRQIFIVPQKNDKKVTLNITIKIENFHYYKTLNGLVKFKLTDAAGKVFTEQKNVLLKSGMNFIKIQLEINEPRLWWPNGLGEAHLYQVATELHLGENCYSYPTFNYGIRFIQLETGNQFAFIINGHKIFCKGANWIPADTIYARVTDERYDKLVQAAKGANFNMLRIWGGGLYERDAFYNACDRHGMLIWHDFMFACAPYPDHLEWFRHEVELEAIFQAERLRNHPCIALWCGSNENNWAFKEWWHEKTKAGAWIYNYLLPEIVEKYCPEIPYWNGSPYGGDSPNSCEVGDRHHWWDCMMHPEMEKRITPEEYDKCNSLFVSEYGYIGAPTKETILRYLNGAPFDENHPVWQHHTNAFEKQTIRAGIQKHYVDPDSLSLDEYILYSGLCQGLMYSYAIESMRYRENCHGSLFWMFNDCWGEVGWTIVDYELRRKIAYYFVKRAYAPVRLILRKCTTGLCLVASNDTLDHPELNIEYGYVSLNGTFKDLQYTRQTLSALSRTEIIRFDMKNYAPTEGLWIARALNEPDIMPAIFHAVEYRHLKVNQPELTTNFKNISPVESTLIINSPVYVHAIQILGTEEVILSDNYFDLLPGEERRIQIKCSRQITPHELKITSLESR